MRSRFLHSGLGPLPKYFADMFGAKCLDGSAQSYELTRTNRSSKWIFFLEGGGATVQLLKNCASRGGMKWPPMAGTPFTSDDISYFDLTSADIGGIMAQ